MRQIWIYLCAVLIVLIAVPAFACYTGMNLIPTVDMVGQRTLRLDLQIEGDTDGIRADTWIFNTQYGISDQFEFGIDHDFSDGASPRNMLNFKYLIPSSNVLKIPISLGVCNVADSTKADLYAVTAYQADFARLHFGYGRLESEDEWFVGADKAIGGYTLMAEYMHGQANSLTLGTSYNLTPYVSLSASYEHPNDDSSDRFIMYFGYSLLIGGKSE